MRFWVKILLGVMSGFAGGFAAGFFTHKKINDVQFEEVSEEELDKFLENAPEPVKIANGQLNATNSRFKAPSSLEKALVDGETDPNKLRMAAAGKTPYMAADDEKKKEYSKMWNAVKQYSNEENANDIPVEDDLDLAQSIDKEFMDVLDDDELPTKKEPYQITLGEFYEERREYDKVTIDWYDEDDVVLDEREEIIPNPETYVGCSMKELFKEPPMDGDPDSIFMRNDTYGTDYEVIRHHASYQKAVLGQAVDDS
jgi:hypothetical protein